MPIPRPRRPFSLIQRSGRKYIYVRFKDPKTGEYGEIKSTKKTVWHEAEAVAWEWVTKGIPQKGGTVSLEFQSFLAYIHKLTGDEKKILAEKLRETNTYAAVIEHEKKQAVNFNEFLYNFWDYDNSPYVRQKIGETPDSIHRRHAADQKAIIEQHWKSFFTGKLLGEITRDMIKMFRLSLNDVWSKGKPLGPGRKQNIMQAGCYPLKWAYTEGLINNNPAAGLVAFNKSPRKPQILTPEMARVLFTVHWNDERAKIANMLAMTTGMRAGEIQGLRVQDVGDDRLYVRHSWNFKDGLKTTKTNRDRLVLTLPGIVPMLLNLAQKNPHGVSPESFVFWADLLPNKPVEGEVFLRGLRAALRLLGKSADEISKINFHAWRHFFTTYMLKRLSSRVLKSQTGHATDAMISHYSDHDLAEDELEIRTAQKELFKDMLPVKLLS